ncbi:hypothetical protein BDN70DRAFT_874190 [Pholiota conissans]|uniref:Uncharacterized protein n=1 Tax=Pholiota conissans TaxID=109636 RepID=A0A9P5Z7Q9_9AGAR|nr:hypothetical protein BDN70DRAFT_874190 [Pholiota conissans]
MPELEKERLQVVLPYELEHDIFELAARAFPGHASKLCTLSKYVQPWMESIIYETVVLELPLITTELFMRTFNSRPPSFFAKNVRRLYTTGVITIHDARRLLTACTGAVEVTCWVYPHALKDSLLSQLPTQNLRRLSIPLETLWGLSPFSTEFTPALFPKLTHLEIVNPQNINGAPQIHWDSLAALPSLTHLALGELFSAHFAFVEPLGVLLDRCPNLTRLVIITRCNAFVDELARSGVVSDERVVVIPEFNAPLNLAEYWDGVRKGGPEFWMLADATAGLRKCLTQDHLPTGDSSI